VSPTLLQAARAAAVEGHNSAVCCTAKVDSSDTEAVTEASADVVMEIGTAPQVFLPEGGSCIEDGANIEDLRPVC
jgi:hypothetical protein